MYIGIDFGSSFLKFACIRASGEVDYTRRIPTIRAELEPYRAEYCLPIMIEAIRTYIDEVIVSGEAVEGILISTQMHGYVLRSAAGDSRYISWQDELATQPWAGSTSFAQLQQLGAAQGLCCSGLPLKPELALCSLYARVCRGEQTVSGSELFTLGSYLIAQLCGKNVTHITNAAPTGLYDLQAGRWNTPLLESVGFGGLRLPTVCREIRPCGTYRGIPIYPDVGDQQASLLGAGLRPGQINVNLGTASQVAMLCDDYDMLSERGGEELRPFFWGKYLRTVSKLSGGRSLQVIVDFLRSTAAFVLGQDVEDAALWQRIAGVAPDDRAGLQVSTGFFSTQLFPGGTISEINAYNFTPENLIRGAFTDLAAQFGRVIARLDPNHQAAEILLSGGRLDELILPYLQRDPVCGSYSIVVADHGEAIFRGLARMLIY